MEYILAPSILSADFKTLGELGAGRGISPF